MMNIKHTIQQAVKKRFIDCPPVYSSYYQLQHDGVLVFCPKCGGDALLRGTHGEYRLTCNRCHFSEQRDQNKPLMAAQGCCISCGRWFNLRLPHTQSTYPRVKVKCPHCKTAQTAGVHSVGNGSADPLDGLTLYLQAKYRGHTVWALNREHLDYLIAYVEAGLREKYIYHDIHGNCYNQSSGQAQRLPHWLKTAKNRPGLLRALHKMTAL